MEYTLLANCFYNRLKNSKRDVYLKYKTENSIREKFKISTYNPILDDSDNDQDLGDDYNMNSLFGQSNLSVGTEDTFTTSNDRLNTNDITALKPIKRRRVTVRRSVNGKSGNPPGQIPEKWREYFDFDEFNKIQSICANKLYEKNNSFVINTPSNSGKTVLLEISILKALETYEQQNNTGLKVIYISPMKSICLEKYNRWKAKFTNLKVQLITSDMNHFEKNTIGNANIIVATPEKIDLICKKWGDYLTFLKFVNLLLIDDIHFLKEERGAVLEVVITRITQNAANLRVIALCTNTGNIDDICSWLNSTHLINKANSLDFSASHGHIRERTKVIGIRSYTPWKETNNSKFNKALFDIIKAQCESKPTIIFCPTKSSAARTAISLCGMSVTTIKKSSTNISFRNTDLQNCYKNSILFYHAGLHIDDRKEVEKNFANGDIQILCCTSKLDIGNNLPVYLVVINGTSTWKDDRLSEYSSFEILQMIGRTEGFKYDGIGGKAIILTDDSRMKFYQKLIDKNITVESSLHNKIIDFILAEVSLGNIKSVNDIGEWINATFMVQRYCKNVDHYMPALQRQGLISLGNISSPIFYEKIIQSLQTLSLIFVNKGNISSTLIGSAMSRHCIDFKTMKSLITAAPKNTVKAILKIVSKVEVFSIYRVRLNEKATLKELNNSQIWFRLLTEGGKPQIIDQPWQKIFLLIQYNLSKPKSQLLVRLTPKLIYELCSIERHFIRVLKCLIDIFIAKNDGISLKNALFVLRSLNVGCWESTPYILKQVKGMSINAVEKLSKMGINSLQQLTSMNREQLELYLGLKPGAGTKLLDEIRRLPILSFHYQAFIDDKNSLNISPYISAKVAKPIGKSNEISVNFLALDKNGHLIDFRRFPMILLNKEQSFTIMVDLIRVNEYIELILNVEEIPGIGLSRILKLENITENISGTKQQIITNSNKIIADSNDELEMDSNLSDLEILELVPSDPNNENLSLPEEQHQKESNNQQVNNFDGIASKNFKQHPYHNKSKQFYKQTHWDAPYEGKSFSTADMNTIKNDVSNHKGHRIFPSSQSNDFDSDMEDKNFVELSRDIQTELAFLGSDIDLQ